MTTPITTSTTDSQMHNNIMAVGLKDRPPMLATGRYAQCQSRFLRYINTRPNGDALRKCILEEGSNSFAIDWNGDEIYSTGDACKTAHDMRIAIKRLQQVSSTTSTRMYQKEVNEIRAERIAKNANPLTHVAAAQQYPDPYYQAPKSHKSYAPPSKQSFSTRSNASTKYKGKKISQPITSPFESASEEDSDPKQAQRDKNKNVDTSPRYTNDNQTGQFGNQRTVTIDRARETVGSQVVQQTGIQYFNCKEFSHFAKECRKPKRVKDYTYHKEKMLLCKQAETCVPLQAEQADWLEKMDEEIDEQELDAHYSYIANIQEVPTADSGTDTEPLEQVQYNAAYNVFANERRHSEQPESIGNTCVVKKVDSNVIPDSPDMCDNDIQTDQNAEECDDECAALAYLITNLTLDTKENKKILKQLNKANASLTQQLKGEQIQYCGVKNTRDSCLIALQFEIQDLKAQLQDKNIAISELKKLIEKCKGKYVETKFDKPSVVRQPNAQRIPKPSVLGKPTPFSDSLERKVFKGQLCSSCEVSKAKRSSFKTKVVPSSKGRLHLLYMDLCGPMRVESINGKKYILVIVDDYSRYTWTLFLRSKDETLEVLKDFLKMIQHNLQAQVITIQTNKGIEFIKKTLHAYFKEERIEHQTSTPQTHKQNNIVERRNHTLVEAARTMLLAFKLPLFFWTEAIVTVCYTQNRSVIILTHEKTTYHIINDRKPSIKHLYIFGCTCYLIRDGENLDKTKKKGIRAFWWDTLLSLRDIEFTTREPD
ncbi:retrovirus-related pol polyprotein from transposon TNT 1-94 [Tanacetum coccineum]